MVSLTIGPPSAESLQSQRSADAIKNARGREYHDNLVKLQKYLDNISVEDLANSESKSGADSLDILHPYLDTLPYIYILQARVALSKHTAKNLAPSLLPGGDSYQKLFIFLTQFDPIAVRYGGSKWRYLMEVMGNIAQASPEPHIVLADMGLAMAHLDPSVGTMTTSHLLFIRLCLETQSYAAAASVLDKDIHSFPGASSTSDEVYYVTDGGLSNAYIDKASGFTDLIKLGSILEYYLLGAMAYIGMGAWAKAVYYLEHVMSVPTSNSAAHWHMVEAYRKWVLCTLLAEGSLPSAQNPIRTANAQSMKVLRNASKHYDAIAAAFALPDASKLHAEIDLGGDVWAEDGNLGLLQKVVQRHRELSVSHLQNVYTALPISVVATKQEIPQDQAEEYLRGLIREGLLNATIEPPTNGAQSPVLRFSQDRGERPDANAASEQDLRDRLVQQTVRMKALAEHINEADRRLQLSREYLDSTLKARRQRDVRTVVEDDGLELAGTRVSSDDDEEMLDA